MGGGDVKLMGMVGAFMGWKLALLTFFLAPFFGAGFGIVEKIRTKDSTIAYGPFLIMGALVSLFWGDKIINFVSQEAYTTYEKDPICLYVCFFIFLFLYVWPHTGPALTDKEALFPIQSITLNYDLDKAILHVEAVHPSDNWERDYVRMMTVSLNGQMVSTLNYYHQTKSSEDFRMM